MKNKLFFLDEEVCIKFASLSKERHISQSEYIRQLMNQEINRFNPNEELKQLEQRQIELDYEKEVVKQKVVEFNNKEDQKKAIREEEIKEAIKRLRDNDHKPVVYQNIVNHFSRLFGMNPEDLIKLSKEVI